ncbi:YabP/YqfC family sporulation protein [Heliophilum fasciatum]|uniref:Sporulation protein YabP n=1 Tax=Heliophilum fasciatum TaxID=35700 RepID=A0A4R2RVK4_9FIRM|nr:YabP/YqfC family sporulation protein [Heliophilum fasciatum]MCW2277032.1 sporulation protein YabP [Heliophilum fasciatum]TCP68442.1 sporulation protein YabP [Heliophilum fasciatum]
MAGGPGGPSGFEVIARGEMIVRGVKQVGAFDEVEILLETVDGPLLLRGEGLHITQLNLDEQYLELAGRINQVQYMEETAGPSLRHRGKNLLTRLWK